MLKGKSFGLLLVISGMVKKQEKVRRMVSEFHTRITLNDVKESNREKFLLETQLVVKEIFCS